MELTEQTLSREKVFSGKIIDVYHSRVALPDGKTAMREVVEHHGAVAILPLCGDELIFVRQYRAAAQGLLLETPAGKLELQEEHEPAARRELREETGMECARLIYLGPIYTSPGILSEIIHIYFADGLTFVGECPDEDEFLQCVRVKTEEIDRMISAGEIIDAKTISALQMARARGLLAAH